MKESSNRRLLVRKVKTSGPRINRRKTLQPRSSKKLDKMRLFATRTHSLDSLNLDLSRFRTVNEFAIYNNMNERVEKETAREAIPNAKKYIEALKERREPIEKQI